MHAAPRNPRELECAEASLAGLSGLQPIALGLRGLGPPVAPSCTLRPLRKARHFCRGPSGPTQASTRGLRWGNTARAKTPVGGLCSPHAAGRAPSPGASTAPLGLAQTPRPRGSGAVGRRTPDGGIQAQCFNGNCSLSTAGGSLLILQGLLLSKAY